SLAIQHSKGIMLQDPAFEICREELICVITRKSESSLRKIVRTKRKEFGFAGDLVGSKSSAWQLDHGSNQILQSHAALGKNLVGDTPNNVLLINKFLRRANQWDHHLCTYHESHLLCVNRGFEDCSRLHLRNFRISNSQTAAAMTEHWIELVQALNSSQKVCALFQFCRISAASLQLRNCLAKL